MIDLTIRRQAPDRNTQEARESGVVVSTFEDMKHPETIPEPTRARPGGVGLWDVDPLSLLHITWKNEPMESDGPYRAVPNYIELFPALTGVSARIIALVGKWFPTGCHKVGVSFSCLVLRLVTGQFDVGYHWAVWPSTGNYCRSSVSNFKLLGVRSMAILPAGMNWKRFEWLSQIAGGVIAALSCEPNVKGTFDKTHELRQEPDCVVFNRFEEMGNRLWHYQITGSAIAEIFETIGCPDDRPSNACSTSGSAGTIDYGDCLKEVYPGLKLATNEILQCPTILEGDFGDHRIEGIDDKHIPQIHSVKNTDMVIDTDDKDSQWLLRLFNDSAGHDYPQEVRVSEETLSQLSLLGTSGVVNMLYCVKLLKYYKLTEHDVVATVLTDSADIYRSRIQELADQYSPYDGRTAAMNHALHLPGLRTDAVVELNYYDRRRVHSLRHYAWAKQQGRDVHELNNLWYGSTWDDVHRQAAALDELITAFNEGTEVLKRL